jgi:hypothetical protein
MSAIRLKTILEERGAGSHLSFGAIGTDLVTG